MKVSIIAYRLTPTSKVYYETYEDHQTARTMGETLSMTYGIPVRVVRVEIGELGL